MSWLRNPVVALTALYVGLFAYFCYQTRVLRPYSDLLDLLDYYFRASERGSFLQYLFEPHGFYHRIPWLRLQVAADASVFGGGGLAFAIPAAVGLVAVAVLMARTVAAASLPALKLPASALAVALILRSANAADISVPACTSYVQTAVFVLLAALLAAPRDGEADRSRRFRRGAALACACAAGFGNAVGLAIWPALAFSAWRAGRRERGWLCAILLVGAAFVAAYSVGWPAPTGGAGLAGSSAAQSLDYFVSYLGLPWVRASSGLGRLIGASLLAACCAAVLRAGGPGAPRAERIALPMILFSLGTAALAAVGRSGEAAGVDVPVRYTILLAPLHLGLLLLLLPWLGRAWEARPHLMKAATLAVFAALVVQQALIGMVASRAAAHVRETIAWFEQGERTADMPAIIHPDLQRAAAIEAEIRRRGLYGREGR